jgi:hypothetical protein
MLSPTTPTRTSELPADASLVRKFVFQPAGSTLTALLLPTTGNDATSTSAREPPRGT